MLFVIADIACSLAFVACLNVPHHVCSTACVHYSIVVFTHSTILDYVHACTIAAHTAQIKPRVMFEKQGFNYGLGNQRKSYFTLWCSYYLCSFYSSFDVLLHRTVFYLTFFAIFVLSCCCKPVFPFVHQPICNRLVGWCSSRGSKSSFSYPGCFHRNQRLSLFCSIWMLFFLRLE